MHFDLTLLFYSEGSTEPVPVPFKKDRFVKGLADIDKVYANDETTRLSKRKAAITQMAAALGTTYDKLVKLGGY